MKKVTILLSIVAATSLPSQSFAQLLLVSSNNESSGCLDCSRYDSESVCNRYGNYGSRYGSDSIWNRYGIGSRYNSDSPWNRYGRGLRIVDRQGNLVGRLSIGFGGSTDYSRSLRRLHDALDGDLSEIRDAFCR